MALHTDIPIYKDAYGLLRLSVRIVLDMRRDGKPLGNVIRDECILLLQALARANAAPNADKPAAIEQMLWHVDTVAFLMRVCFDERLIGEALWKESVRLMGSVGDQGGGWKKYFVKLNNKKVPAA